MNKIKKYIFCYDQYSYFQDQIITHHIAVYARNLKEAKDKLSKLGYKDIYVKKRKKVRIE